MEGMSGTATTKIQQIGCKLKRENSINLTTEIETTEDYKKMSDEELVEFAKKVINSQGSLIKRVNKILSSPVGKIVHQRTERYLTQIDRICQSLQEINKRDIYSELVILVNEGMRGSEFKRIAKYLCD